ncbi:MAG: efflux transporter outer membrane subunit [Planctomycetota bacterium]
MSAGPRIASPSRVVRLAALCVSACALACRVGPDYERPEIEAPPAYLPNADEDDSLADLAWWDLFQDPVLIELIDTALVENRDLRTAVARIDEAAATLGIVSSDLYPRLDYAGSAIFDATTAGDGDTSNSRAAFLSAGWQVDLWGRFRRASEAAFQELLATEDAARAVRLSLVAAVAESYIVLRDLDNRQSISEQTAETRRENLDIIQARFDGGSVTEVDLNQAQIQLYEAEASVQVFARRRRQTENALSVLLGSPPLQIPRGLELGEQLLLPELPAAGLPSELLDRRPDVLAAERRLHAQTERIGVAEALRFPQFDLTSSIGASGNGVSAGFFQLGANLFGPIYNAGELKSNIAAEVARAEQSLFAYEQAILDAWREVEDALVAVETLELELATRSRQVAAAQNAADLAWSRYDEGFTSYLELLETQRALFSAELAESETRQLLLNAVVDLYAALGGGW